MDELQYAGLLMKAQKGVPMTEYEANSFELEQGLRLKRFRSFDFGQLEFNKNCGNLEANALRERNARWAAKWPKRPEARPSPYEDVAFNGPYLSHPDGLGHQRDLEAHKAEVQKMRAGVYSAR